MVLAIDQPRFDPVVASLGFQPRRHVPNCPPWMTGALRCMAAPSYAVEVELPEECFRHRAWSPTEVAANLRLLWLVDQVRQRRMGYATAARLAPMPQAAFLAVLGEHHVSAVDFDEHEIDSEVAAGRALGRS